MRFLDPNGLVSLIGLLAETGVVWILTLVFALMLRPAERSGYFVDWTRGFCCVAIGLSAVSIRYFAPLLVADWVEPFRDDAWATRALLLVYQAAKCLAAVYFLRGTVRLVRGESAARERSWMIPAVLIFAVATALPADEVEQVLFWQSLLYVPMLFFAGAMLWRLPRERRDQGVRITATAFQLLAALWVIYGTLTVTQFFGIELVSQRGSLPHVILSHNSYFDLALFVALAAGMIVLLMMDLQRRSRAAQEQRTRLELQLERGERLRALGSLVSSVAHDLNNPLTAVLGFAAELERSQQGTVDGESARIVREQAERCRAIVQKLSSLVGDHPTARRLVDPAELVERVARGLKPRLMQEGLRIEVDAAAGLPALYADPFGLEEVLDNVLDNAIQFSSRGGRILISMRMEDEMLALRVRDEGFGVPEALRQRIFDPFFSLRRDGSGTGIGLSVALGIAKAHAGSLALEAPDGAPGASFLLRLPPALPEALPERAEDVPQQRASSAPSRSRCVLVVDDERLVRKVLRRWLQQEGWDSEEAEDGAAALKRLTERPQSFHAVLCDLRMPNLSGAELHDRLGREHPELLLRTIFITGDLASPEAASFSSRCTRPIVRKPFDFAELRAAIEQLDAPTPRAATMAPTAGLLLVLTLPFVACAKQGAPQAPPVATVKSTPAAPAADPVALYGQHCAFCHGPSGDGDGTLALDRPARSFKQGGFSFGNTEEAIFRTVSSGIGGTPMPGFAHLLSEDERRALARHVIALGPEQVPGPGFASVLAVGDRPVVVRGQFAPLVEGGPEFPRGLLVGNPDGLSYQYAADDLRLLAVRQGPFVDRKDWGERGGLPLEPLGRVIYLAGTESDDDSDWRAGGEALRARLLSTSTTDASAIIRYALLTSSGERLATVEESCTAAIYAAGSGFSREYRVTLASPQSRVHLWAARVEIPTPATAQGPWFLSRRNRSTIAFRSHGEGVGIIRPDGIRLSFGIGEEFGNQDQLTFTVSVEVIPLSDDSAECFEKLVQETK